MNKILSQKYFDFALLINGQRPNSIENVKAVLMVILMQALNWCNDELIARTIVIESSSSKKVAVLIIKHFI